MKSKVGILGLLSVIVVGVALGASLLQASLTKVQEKLAPSSVLNIQVEPKKEKPTKTWDLLVIGNDERTFGIDAGGGSRSDSVWLVRMDANLQTINVWSLPRDWMVNIPGTSRVDKLTNTYGEGGVKLLLQTIEKETKVKVDGVMMLRFEAFSRLVNRLGCLYTDIDRRYYNKNLGTPETNYAEIDLKPGYQKVCGLDALSFARHRHSDNDLVRSRRQLSILKSAQLQWTGRTLLSSPSAMLDLLPYVNTTVHKKKDLLSLAETAFSLKNTKVNNIKWLGHIEGANVVASHNEVNQMRSLWYSQPKKQRKSRKEKKSKPKTLFSTKRWKTLRIKNIALRVPDQATNIQLRKYNIDTPSGKQEAWRMIIKGWQGQAAGIQWTSWQNPPILKDSSLIYKKACGGIFWVANDLTSDVNKKEQKALLRQASCSWLKES